MSDEYGPIENIPAVMVSFDHQVSDGRIIRFNTGIAQSAEPGEFNALLDKLSAAADRQAAKFQLETLKMQIEKEEKLYVMRQEDFLRLDEEAKAAHEASNRKAPFSLDKLPANKLQERTNADIFIKRTRDNIVAMRAEVARLSGLVHGANGSTNNH